MRLGNYSARNFNIQNKGNINSRVAGIVGSGPRKSGIIIGPTRQLVLLIEISLVANTFILVMVLEHRVPNLKLIAPNQIYHILFSNFNIDCIMFL